VNARDRRWTPPDYQWLYGAVVRRRAPFLQSLQPVSLSLEAVERRDLSTGFHGMVVPAGMGDSVVGHMLQLHAVTPAPATACLAMFNSANDEDTLDQLLNAAWQQGAPWGIQRVIAPCALSPSLSAGLLIDHFNLAPPLHTPYNAPYLPELMDGAMEPLRYSRLWHLPSAALLPEAGAPASLQIVPFDVARLAGDLLPLALATAQDSAPVGDPVWNLTAEELAFALRVWAVAPLIGRLALADGEPVGFYLAQSDVGEDLRRLRGARPLWGRAVMALRPLRRALAGRTTAGRVLLGGVVPGARRRGIGLRLLADIQMLAVAAGWQSIVVGPVAEKSDGAHFMDAAGATPVQRYCLFVQE
jgi:hypothetical protein